MPAYQFGVTLAGLPLPPLGLHGLDGGSRDAVRFAAGKAGGKLGGAALAGWMALLFLSIAVWEWLSSALNSRGWAAVIVMAVWAIVGAVLFSLGRRDLKNIQGLERTVATTKQVPEALKGHEETL